MTDLILDDPCEESNIRNVIQNVSSWACISFLKVASSSERHPRIDSGVTLRRF